MPGGLPTLCSGTNRVETLVLTLCKNGGAGGFVSVPAGVSTFEPRPPHVILLRKDWDDVRRPRLGCGSEKDLGGAVCEGE